jgi:hypothetical protein
MGGHWTVPYEQNTQQSPCLGRRTALQFSHSENHWRASFGMISVFV